MPRRPQVEILEPGARQSTDAGGTLRLRGAAADGSGRAIPGRRLVWRAGGRLLGRGATVGAVLPAGARSIRLEATDAAGRRGVDTVAVRVRPTTPFFVRLAAPAIARAARTAVLTVAATQPATLTVRGRRFAVGPRRAACASRSAPPGRIRLTLTLSAGGRRSVNTITVRRR